MKFMRFYALLRECKRLIEKYSNIETDEEWGELVLSAVRIAEEYRDLQSTKKIVMDTLGIIEKHRSSKVQKNDFSDRNAPKNNENAPKNKKNAPESVGALSQGKATNQPSK